MVVLSILGAKVLVVYVTYMKIPVYSTISENSKVSM